jgi:hypothetical protein
VTTTSTTTSTTDASPAPTYVTGLDLAQLSDFSALAVLERTEQPAPKGGRDARPVRNYVVRSLHRWPQRTGYTTICNDVVRTFSRPPLAATPLVVDRTGVGVAVNEMLAKARPNARLVPVMIVAGAQTTCDEDGCWHTPKKELVSMLQVLLSQGRLQISPMPMAKVLGQELQTFKSKINLGTGNESLEAWRSRDHDDLVLAVALAAWYAGRAQKQVWLRIAGEGRAAAGPETSHRPDGDGWTWDSLYGWQRTVSGGRDRTPADWTADRPGPGWRRVFNGRR